MREVAIVSAVRTAVGKAGKGALKDVRPDTLAGHVLKASLERSGVEGKDVEDVILGCAMPEGEQGMNVAKIASFLAGLPNESTAATVNRFCSSGLHAVSDIAKSIMVGQIDVGIAGGVESMSMVPMGGFKPSANPELMASNPNAYVPMGITAENVARKFEISREDQDAFALESHIRAANAIDKHLFRGEILPIEVDVYSESGKKSVTFDTDEGPRRDSTLAALAKLRPVFDAKGTVTAGNASQVSDGAAAVLMMDAERAKKEGREILGYFRAFHVAGVPPELMGIGPVPAVRKLLAKTGLKIEDIGVVELNEAFASQAVYCMRELGFAHEIVNPNGGAIALGHPLGCTGSRQVATILPELQRRDAKWGICTMCIGGGMGAAGLIERA